MTYKEMAKLLKIKPSRLLKNYKFYEKQIKELGYIKQGRGKNAIYIENNESVDLDQLCYMQLLEHLIESGCIKNGKRFNYDNFLIYIAFILGQEKREVLSKKDYMKAIGISESTYENYRKYLKTLGLLQPYNLSPTKYYAITKIIGSDDKVITVDGAVQKYHKEISQQEYYSIYRGAYENRYINLNDIEYLEEIINDKSELTNQSLKDILREYGYYYIYSVSKTIFKSNVLQEVGLMDMICRAIRYKHKELVKLKKIDENYILD